MRKPTGPTNPRLLGLMEKLELKSKKEKVAVWGDVARRFSKPTRRRAAVNLSKISRCARKGETILVPGKVLGSGVLTKPVNVAAFSFSESARKSISDSNGVALSILELMDQNPKGSKVRIMV